MTWNRRQQGLKRLRKWLAIMRRKAKWSASYYDDDAVSAKRHLKARVVCSGPCCGNPRRHFGRVTRQERLAPTAQEEGR